MRQTEHPYPRTETAMTSTPDEYWKQEFEKRVREIKQREPAGDLHEHRTTPRYRFPKRTMVQVSGPPIPYRILNISAGGAAILAERNLEPGTHLMLSLKNSVFVEIEVVSCDLMESDSATMDFAYHTRCRFVNNQDGFMAFVLLAES